MCFKSQFLITRADDYILKFSVILCDENYSEKLTKNGKLRKTFDYDEIDSS